MSPVDIVLMTMAFLAIVILMSIPAQVAGSTFLGAMMALVGPYLLILLAIGMIVISFIFQSAWTFLFVIAGIMTLLFGLLHHERLSFNNG